MKVRMKVYISGLRNGKGYPAVGEVMELQAGDPGDDLIRNGYAEKVGPVAAVERVIETAVVAPVETAARRISKPKPKARKSSRPAKEEG